MNPGNVRLLHAHEPSEALCPFSANGHSILMAQPQRPFKPLGLMLWGVPDGACVTPMIACDLQLIVSFGDLPAKWFTTAQSFAEIVKMLDDGKQPPSWGQWKTVVPGVTVQLRFTAPGGSEIPTAGIQALMWGIVPGEPELGDQYRIATGG